MATQNQNPTRDNQKLQNTANQRSEELKPAAQTTAAGETSKAGPSARDQDTNVEVSGGSQANRDVETFDKH